MKVSIILIVSGLMNIAASSTLIYVRLCEKREVKAAYNTGYHDARKIYECDHDRAECEVLTENY